MGTGSLSALDYHTGLLTKLEFRSKTMHNGGEIMSYGRKIISISVTIKTFFEFEIVATEEF